MCGISGVLNRSNNEILRFLETAKKLQLHRGPDSQDQTIIKNKNWNIGLGHQRLSIIDLSNSGNQPMQSSSGSSIIVYNGEVYNYKELREKYFNKNTKSTTDTEIILNIIEKIGIQKALKQFNGMWAFAWYDKFKKKLYLSRDRTGIKPLYYYNDGETFYFASEIKTVLEGPSKKLSLNKQVVGEYLLQSLQDTSESTFFNEIKSLPAGCFAEIDLNKKKISLEIKSYWELSKSSKKMSFKEAQSTSKNIFFDAVKLCMRSDVPIGVTLSGGIDSSAIASVMKKHMKKGQDLKILSSVSQDGLNDESKFIKIMSDYLENPVEKVELKWSSDQAIDLMYKATWQNDSPLGSFSNIAHYLLMKKANELGIKVILSGQGADELLCGYKKYLGFYIQSLIKKHQYLKSIYVFISFIINGNILKQFNFQEAKRYLPNFFKKKDINIKGPALKDYKHVPLGLQNGETINDRQIKDLKKLSVPYLNHYEDRMSMAWSREIRLPFLDYRLIDFFVSLPTNYKLGSGWTKYIFRNSMQKFLPKQITWRKDKQGFLTPQEKWIRDELREQILEVFNEKALIFKLGFVDRVSLLKKYEKFCNQSSGKGKVWYRDIFNPFAFEIWLQLYKNYINIKID